ncbi:MAG: hypothetical protein MUF51_04880 [Vicinamibacteria bacterium]|jgi:hypothetical protein|nr:hypothetical protein [Vicinamibacteria bacterium]
MTRCPRLLTLIALLALLSGCELFDNLDDRLRSCDNVSVALINDPQTRDAVHILADDEDWSEATWLPSGASRRVELCLEKAHTHKFRALRNDVTIGTAKCVGTRATYEGAVVSVAWTLNGFACVGW